MVVSGMFVCGETGGGGSLLMVLRFWIVRGGDLRGGAVAAEIVVSANVV